LKNGIAIKKCIKDILLYGLSEFNLLTKLQKSKTLSNIDLLTTGRIMELAKLSLLFIAMTLLMISTANNVATLAFGQTANQSSVGSSVNDNCGFNAFSPPCLQDFSAQLNGSSEVPPVNTQAKGSALFKLISNETGQAFQYEMNVSRLTTAPMAAHIHSGKVGEDGPIVVKLDQGGIVRCCMGTITEDDLEGPLKGKTLVDLIKMMLREETYVNVHSAQYPDGKIREQILSSSNITRGQ
jgi:hypothetical protein